MRWQHYFLKLLWKRGCMLVFLVKTSIYLLKLTFFMILLKRKSGMLTFVNAQINYSLLVWMLDNKELSK